MNGTAMTITSYRAMPSHVTAEGMWIAREMNSGRLPAAPLCVAAPDTAVPALPAVLAGVAAGRVGWAVAPPAAAD